MTLERLAGVNGQWAITTEFVEGDTLAALMAAHPEKEDEYLNLFVDIQMKVHACTCPMLNSLTEKMQRKISATDLDATTRYELHTRLASMHVHKKVCHGDFNPKTARWRRHCARIRCGSTSVSRRSRTA